QPGLAAPRAQAARVPARRVLLDRLRRAPGAGRAARAGRRRPAIAHLRGSRGPRRRCARGGDRGIRAGGARAPAAARDGVGRPARARGGARDPGERRDGGARGAGRSTRMSYFGEASRAVRVHAPWRVLLVAGEASGDLHGADLLRALRARRPDVEVFGLGGEHLRAAGMHTIADAREVATVGVVEGVGRLRTLLRVYRTLARRLREERPDLCVLIYFPEFNLRPARVARASPHPDGPAPGGAGGPVRPHRLPGVQPAPGAGGARGGRPGALLHRPAGVG